MNAVRVILTETNTHIENSHKVKYDFSMEAILEKERDNAAPNLAIHKRTIGSMVNEWKAHNLLYSLGICRTRTKSVDLEYPEKWYMKMLYFIISKFYWE